MVGAFIIYRLGDIANKLATIMVKSKQYVINVISNDK
jgi:hypothetical protein